MKRNPKLKGYEMIPHTSGVILNGIYFKKDKKGIMSEIKVRLAWGGDIVIQLQPTP